MANHLFLPLLVPLLGAVLAVLLRRPAAGRWIVAASTAIHLGYSVWLLARVAGSGRQVVQASAWAAPYGITLAADTLSAMMLLLAALLTAATLVFARATLDPAYNEFAFEPMLLLLLFGVSGAFLAGDLFNLYVWFEVLLMASFGLLTLGGAPGQLEGGLKYLVLNLVGSTCFLIGAGLMYGVVGTLNMAQLGQRLATVPSPGATTVLASLFLVAYGTKAGIFPLSFWLPASYHTPAPAVSAIFGGLLTKVGIYSLYRVFGLIFRNELPTLAPLMLGLAAATMLIGALGALVQPSIRRTLAYMVVSSVGFLLLGLGLNSAAGMAAGVLYMTHTMLVTAALFLLGGAVEHLAGTGDLARLGGVAQREPLLATLWFLGMLALLGIPPLSGFVGKLALLQAAAAQGQYLLLTVALCASLLGFLPLLRIWNTVFWRQLPPKTPVPPRATPALVLPGAALVACALALGLLAGPATTLSASAATQVLDVAGYVRAVLGP
jgi:multicomponent Na+:H+ antiporter subunit D